MTDIALQQTFTLTSCCTCGIAFAVPHSFLERRRENGASFWCPNGHSLSYSDTELDKLRRAVAAKQRELEAKQAAVDQAHARERAIGEQLAKEQRAKKRLAKRLENGVCPVPGCKRHFTNLQRHISTEHNGVALPPPANEQKALPAGKEQIQ